MRFLVRFSIFRERHNVFLFVGVLVGVLLSRLLDRFGYPCDDFDTSAVKELSDDSNYRIYAIRKHLVDERWNKNGIAPFSEQQPDELLHDYDTDTHAPADIRNENAHLVQNDAVSRFMYKKVRILCWVLTSEENHKRRAQHVKATWAKRCNKYVFMSTVADETLPSIALEVHEGRDALWGKTKRAFEWCYDNHLNDFDWFLKADDDTYVVVENLRYLLSNHSPTEPVYFGKRFKPFTKQGYMSGGAGYVLSREALRRFVEIGLRTPDMGLACKTQDDTGAEDVEMGICMDTLHVKAGDSLDVRKRSKFFPFPLEFHLTFGRKNYPKFWYWNYTKDDEKTGVDCCSDFAITFHYISSYQMYLYDFLIYHLKPFGVAYDYGLPPQVLALRRGLEMQSLQITNSKATTMPVTSSTAWATSPAVHTLKIISSTARLTPIESKNTTNRRSAAKKPASSKKSKKKIKAKKVKSAKKAPKSKRKTPKSKSAKNEQVLLLSDASVAVPH